LGNTADGAAYFVTTVIYVRNLLMKLTTDVYDTKLFSSSLMEKNETVCPWQAFWGLAC
jgi:hypothetical protein